MMNQALINTFFLFFAAACVIAGSFALKEEFCSRKPLYGSVALYIAAIIFGATLMCVPVIAAAKMSATQVYFAGPFRIEVYVRYGVGAVVLLSVASCLYCLYKMFRYEQHGSR